ncbi:hydrolase [Penicillium verhagenii]|uniref:hydrolase n=1 Tax=Penicillium verhagenii TaxID=1562060 RepID=UPI002545148D|nr:hydrolase [Penicillium verhagenii]KAJ5947143.1 hydrolase [Penicillium verhagenii]
MCRVFCSVGIRHPNAGEGKSRVFLNMNPLSYISRSRKVSFYHSSTSYQLVQKNEDTPISLAELCKECTPPLCSLSPLLFNGHLQTAWTQKAACYTPVYYKRKIFDSNHSSYEGQFSVDFVVPPYVDTGGHSETNNTEDLPPRTELFEAEEDVKFLSADDSRPILLVLHGMSGGSNEPYIQDVLAAVVAQEGGWAACVVNSRGCANSKLTSGFLYNGRSTWDFRQVVDWLKDKFPNRPLFGIGFSIGANVLTHYLGEEGRDCALKAAIMVSNPWKLEVASHALRQSWIGKEIYSKILGRNMRDIVERHIDMITAIPTIDRDSIRKIKYVQDFDRMIQCPTWGYLTEDAYYRDASCADAMLAIRIPFLAIQAEDDPISPKHGIPFAEFARSPFGVLCMTPGGGHLGWFEADGGRWFLKPLTRFLDKMLNSVNLEKSTELNKDLDVNFDTTDV